MSVHSPKQVLNSKKPQSEARVVSGQTLLNVIIPSHVLFSLYDSDTVISFTGSSFWRLVVSMRMEISALE